MRADTRSPTMTRIGVTRPRAIREGHLVLGAASLRMCVVRNENEVDRDAAAARESGSRDFVVELHLGAARTADRTQQRQAGTGEGRRRGENVGPPIAVEQHPGAGLLSQKQLRSVMPRDPRLSLADQIQVSALERQGDLF